MTARIEARATVRIREAEPVAETDRPLTIADVMTVSPIAVSIDTPLVDVADALERFDISGAPVVDWGGALVGVISQTDLLHARAREELWRDWPELYARHLMSSPAIAVREETPLNDAIALMERRGVHRVVVVAPDGEEPIGIFSTSDLVRLLAEAPEGSP